MQETEHNGTGTFTTNQPLNRKIFPNFERERFPFYFNYIEYRAWPKGKGPLKIMDLKHRSVYIRIKYYKPIHPFYTYQTNRLWKEHLAFQKIVL